MVKPLYDLIEHYFENDNIIKCIRFKLLQIENRGDHRPKRGDQQTPRRVINRPKEMVVRRGLKDATSKLWLKFEELKQEAKKRGANQEEG